MSCLILTRLSKTPTEYRVGSLRFLFSLATRIECGGLSVLKVFFKNLLETFLQAHRGPPILIRPSPD